METSQPFSGTTDNSLLSKPVTPIAPLPVQIEVIEPNPVDIGTLSPIPVEVEAIRSEPRDVDRIEPNPAQANLAPGTVNSNVSPDPSIDFLNRQKSSSLRELLPQLLENTQQNPVNEAFLIALQGFEEFVSRNFNQSPFSRAAAELASKITNYEPQITNSPTIPQLVLPPLPNFDNLRQQFARNEVIPKEQGNGELIQAIGRLENVMKAVRSPVVNQANTTNNTFESGAIDNGDLARRIEQQQRDIQYRLLKELERRAI